jgi:drug/metabolite transporter (DMT)-like permease
MQHRREKLIRWLIFNVLVGLVPIVISYLGLRLDPHPPALHVLTSRGELLLISTAIASAAVGELIPGGRDKATQKLLAGGCCILLVLVSSLFFATIQARQHPDVLRIFTMSLWLFGGTLLASFSAVYLAWEGEP